MSSTVNPSSLNLNTVEPLTGVNYRKWKQDLEIVLGVMDWDLALRTEEPPAPTDDSTSNQKSKYEKWHKSNRISLLIIKRSMTDVVRGAFTDATNAKDFLKSIEQKYQESSKTETDATNANDFLKSIEEKYQESPKIETGNLMNSLTTMRHDGIESVRGYILKMVDIAGKLEALEVLIPETFLVHVILSSLPDSYTHLKLSYNALREKWDVNELISVCVSEEERMKKSENEKIESLNYVRSTTEAHTPLTTDATRKNSTKRVPSPKRNTKPNKPSILKRYFCIRLGLPHEERTS